MFMLRSKRGFTLVELIVVIIIIGVLAAIAAPLMTGNVNRARRAEAVAACGAIRTAARLWQAENAGNPTLAQAMAASGMVTADLNGPNYDGADYNIDGGIIRATGTPGNVNMSIATGDMNGN